MIHSMRRMGTQQYFTVRRHQMKSITLFYEKRWKQQLKLWLKMGKSAGVDTIPAELVQAARRKSHDRHPDLNLQHDLEDREMADHMDSISSYHTPKERQLAAVQEL